MELSAPERRVLGCLIEKERTTPQGYPLTLNALRSACTQTTNRDPIVDYDEATIEQALVSLRERGLTRIVYSTSNRAAKYRHIAAEHFRLGDDEIAVLAVLLLRGPQTVGEIKGRTERLFAFADLQAVQSTLERLAAREDDPLVVRYARRPGQKDARWGHLLGEPGDDAGERVGGRETDAEVDDDYGWVPPASSTARGARRDGPAPATPAGDPPALVALTDEVADLRRQLEQLRSEFERFRSEFG